MELTCSLHDCEKEGEYIVCKNHVMWIERLRRVYGENRRKLLLAETDTDIIETYKMLVGVLKSIETTWPEEQNSGTPRPA